MTKTPPPKAVKRPPENCTLCQEPIPDDSVRYVMGEHEVCCETCHRKRRRKRHA